MLERYFRTKLIEQMSFTRIGSYWDRKGENEIDLVAVNESDQYVEIIEIKRNAANIDFYKLNTKSIHFHKATGELSGYDIRLKGYSMKDM